MIFSDSKSFVAGDRVERRLAAILVADVAGYSRLMHLSEETTHARVTALMTSGVLPVIAEHSGRVIKNTGDGFLAEFYSAVDAVRAAMQFQGEVYRLAMPDAPEERILFRVGIHVGDIIVELKRHLRRRGQHRIPARGYRRSRRHLSLVVGAGSGPWQDRH